jgi:hypothetical protein
MMGYARITACTCTGARLTEPATAICVTVNTLHFTNDVRS